MKLSTDTSEFLDYRKREIVPKRLKAITEAIEAKDWNTLCEITMKESNSLHACCLDTYPPIFYMNETTKSICSLIHDLNGYFYEPVAAYTVDAGANCFLITKQAHLEFLLGVLEDVSGLDESKIKYSFKDQVETEHNQIDFGKINEIVSEYKSKVNLHQMIVTRIGKGVQFKK